MNPIVDLEKMHCTPCEGNTPKLPIAQAQTMLKDLPGWELQGEKLHKQFKFKTFMDTIEFVQQMARLAEEEGHHPNFCVNYRELEVSLWTHAIHGLSDNDFILAAKINALMEENLPH